MDIYHCVTEGHRNSFKSGFDSDLSIAVGGAIGIGIEFTGSRLGDLVLREILQNFHFQFMQQRKIFPMPLRCFGRFGFGPVARGGCALLIARAERSEEIA